MFTNSMPSLAHNSLVVVLLSAQGIAAAASSVTFPPARPPGNDIKVENRVPIPMRDGVVLYAGRVPACRRRSLPGAGSRTPYSTERYPRSYEPAVFFARRGYVFLFQDVRGRHESEGEWDPMRNEMEDGYDTIEWAAGQPWSNGKVGMQGGSYLGGVQWKAAKLVPPHLVTIFPNVADTSAYHHAFTLNGGFRLSLAFGWGAVRNESRVMQNPGPHTMESGPEGISYEKVIWHLPLIEMPKLVGRRAKAYIDWIEHPNYDDYWKALSVEERFEKIPIPVHTFGGWFDILLQGTLNGYVGMSQQGKTAVARNRSRMIVGPWGHGPSRKHGDLDFGEHADVDLRSVELRWFDYWLKGVETGIDDAPPEPCS